MRRITTGSARTSAVFSRLQGARAGRGTALRPQKYRAIQTAFEEPTTFQAESHYELFRISVRWLVGCNASCQRPHFQGAKKELLIYDRHIGNPAMMRLLGERSSAGVVLVNLGSNS